MSDHICTDCGGHMHREYFHCEAHPYVQPVVFTLGNDIVAECPVCDEDENIIVVLPIDVKRLDETAGNVDAGDAGIVQ